MPPHLLVPEFALLRGHDPVGHVRHVYILAGRDFLHKQATKGGKFANKAKPQVAIFFGNPRSCWNFADEYIAECIGTYPEKPVPPRRRALWRNPYER